MLVGTPTIAKALTMTIPANDGAVTVDPSSHKIIGLIDINWFDPQIQTKLTSLHFTANMLPIFLANNVYLTGGAPVLANCCIGGYHNAVSNQAGLQTYIWTNEADHGSSTTYLETVIDEKRAFVKSRMVEVMLRYSEKQHRHPLSRVTV